MNLENARKLAKAARELAGLYEKDEGPLPGKLLCVQGGTPCCAFGQVIGFAGLVGSLGAAVNTGGDVVTNTAALEYLIQEPCGIELVAVMAGVTLANDEALQEDRRTKVAPALARLADVLERRLL